jgi:hypothetical protein
MFFPLHILGMALATFGMMTGVGAAVFSRKRRNWLNIHKTFNSLSLLAAAAGIIFAFIGIVKDGGPHLQGYHPLIGC